MEEEKSILDATEYVLMALNEIKSFEQFIDYKEEIEKAVQDIRNSITNIINLKKNNNQNLNDINKSNKQSISSMLGLKFNYDAYLNDFNINNLNKNNLNFNYNNQNNIINNNMQKDQKAMFKNFVNDFQNKYRSIISELFYGMNYNKTECLYCHSTLYNYQ